MNNNNLYLVLEYVNKLKTDITNGMHISKINKTDYALLSALIEEIMAFIIKLCQLNTINNNNDYDDVSMALIEVVAEASKKYKTSTKSYQTYMEALEDFAKRLQIKKRIKNTPLPFAAPKTKSNQEDIKEPGTYTEFDNSSRTYTMTFKSST